MSDDRTLGLDVDPAHPGHSRTVARVALVVARTYTRVDGHPTLTRDCADLPELEREVARLHEELDAALVEARAHFANGDAPAERSQAAPAPTEKREIPALRDDLRVSDVMTRTVKTVRANDRLELADELMHAGRFRHLVVVAEDGSIAGVVSQRDFFFGALSWSMGQGRKAHDRALEITPVKEVMRSQVETTHPDASLAEAARTMREARIGCLPVLDGDALVGIVTEGDFLALWTA